jgi:hypothetical protein
MDTIHCLVIKYKGKMPKHHRHEHRREHRDQDPNTMPQRNEDPNTMPQLSPMQEEFLGFVFDKRIKALKEKEQANSCCDPNKDCCNALCCDCFRCCKRTCFHGVQCCKWTCVIVAVAIVALIIGTFLYGIWYIGASGISTVKSTASNVHSWAENKASYFVSNPPPPIPPPPPHAMKDTGADPDNVFEWLTGEE